MKRAVLVLAAFAACAFVVATPPQKPAGAGKGYAPVAAILKARCQGCHQGDGAAAKFDVTTFAKVMAGGKDGKMVVAGKPDKSILIAYLKGTKKPQMPIGNKPLTAAEMKTITTWIASGAKEK